MESSPDIAAPDMRALAFEYRLKNRKSGGTGLDLEAADFSCNSTVTGLRHEDGGEQTGLT
jgi:hypothetical protein